MFLTIFLKLILLFTLLLIFVIALFLFLKNKSSYNASFFNSVCLGHRGAIVDGIAENSMSAFNYAFTEGADGIEIDVQLTGCGRLVVFHDTQSVERVMKVGARAKISDITYDEIQRLDFRSVKNPGSNNKIPLLEDVVLLMTQFHERQQQQQNHKNGQPKKKKKKFKLMIELKEFRPYESRIVAKKIIRLFKKHTFLYENSIVGSFNPYILYILRRNDPKIITNLLYWRNIMSYYLFCKDSMDYPDLSMIVKFREDGKNRFLRYLCPFIDVIYNLSMYTWLPSFVGAGVVGIDVKILPWYIIKFFYLRGYSVNTWGVSCSKKKEFLIQEGVSVTTDYVF